MQKIWSVLEMLMTAADWRCAYASFISRDDQWPRGGRCGSASAEQILLIVLRSYSYGRVSIPVHNEMQNLLHPQPSCMPRTEISLRRISSRNPSSPFASLVKLTSQHLQCPNPFFRRQFVDFVIKELYDQPLAKFVFPVMPY